MSLKNIKNKDIFDDEDKNNNIDEEKDMFMTESICSIIENNGSKFIVLNFPGRTIKIKLSELNYIEDIENIIKNKNYCNGCISISSLGYYGNKKVWCCHSRALSTYINISPSFPK